MPTQRENVSVYRYFLYDLLSDTFLAEVPFKGVSYGRALKEAGSFSGSIPVIEATSGLDLYNSTMPGKTALFIVRNDVCVWGGMIWSRSYNIINRTLSVNANEFTSYLHHRVIWHTLSDAYGCSITISNGVGSVVLNEGGSYTFAAGMPLALSFGNENAYKYNGFYVVSESPAPTTTSFSFDATTWFNPDLNDGLGGDATIPNLVDSSSTVEVRTDTYHYLREMLEELMIDFSDLNFSDMNVEPGISRKFVVTSATRSSDKTTFTLDADHWMVDGQKVKITNVADEFDGIYNVESIPAANQITVPNPGTSKTVSSVTAKSASIIAKEVLDTYAVILTTDSAHGFNQDDVVDISGVDTFIDGTYLIDGTTTDTFTITTPATITKKTAVHGGMAYVKPLAIYGEYGSFSANSNLNLTFSNLGYSGYNTQNTVIRGYELKSAGDYLDAYSSQLNGFEYRIDCSYDKNTNKFSKTFVILPYKPQSYKDYVDSLPGGVLPTGQAAPPSALGADRVVFEHPGNILDATMEENAEEGATRVWYSGADTTLGAEAAQPYSGASANDYLGGLEFPWPILDSVQKPPRSNLGESTLYDYAQAYLYDSLPPVSSFTVSVNGSLSPEVGSYSPGDWCSIRLDDIFVQDRLNSHIEPRTDILVRKIDSFTVSVPDTPTFPERVELQLVTEAQVDQIGSSKTA